MAAQVCGDPGRTVLPDARDHFPPPGDRSTVQQVGLPLVKPTVFALPFGTKPEAIAVRADPAPGVPARAAAVAARLPFELIEQDEVVHGVVVNAVALHIRKRRSAVGVGQRRRTFGRLRGVGW